VPDNGINFRPLFFMNKSIYFEIEKELKSLPINKIKEVNDFIKFLLLQTRTEKADFKELCGSISDKDSDLIRKSIEDGCERINYERW